jgi:hypothetical protein
MLWRLFLASLAVIVSTAITILIVEAALRVIGVSYPVFDTYDDARGVALRPEKAGWYDKEGRAYVRINKLGYRDINRDEERRTEAYRIAVLGDSFTVGRQVKAKDTFPSLLAEKLRACPELGGVA